MIGYLIYPLTLLGAWSALYYAINFFLQVEEQAERSRLLYVATTRAADYLILSSGVSQLGSKGGSPWLKLLEQNYDLWTGTYLSADNADSPCPQGAHVRVTVDVDPYSLT